MLNNFVILLTISNIVSFHLRTYHVKQFRCKTSTIISLCLTIWVSYCHYQYCLISFQNVSDDARPYLGVTAIVIFKALGQGDLRR